MGEQFSRIVNMVWEKLPELVLTLVFGILLIKLVKLVVHRLVKVSLANKAMRGVLLSVLDFGLWLFLFATIFHEIGLTQLSFALSGSVIALVVAAASGSSAFVQDVVAGIFLAQDRDFKLGSRIKVDTTEGLVERMDGRKVRIRDDKGNLHVYPNSQFDRGSWVVKEEASSQGGRRRVG